MSTENIPSASSGPSYSYRPSVLGATWSFRLTPNAILWDAGRWSGRLPYDQVTRVRMSFRPAALQNQRFLTEVWAGDGTKLQIVSSSWKSMIEQTRDDVGYSRFVADLHRELVAAGTQAAFVSGANPVLYWSGLAVFVVTALMLATLIVLSLQARATTSAIIIGCFMAAFLWHAGNFFRRNRPRRYSPDGLPAEQLPAGG